MFLSRRRRFGRAARKEPDPHEARRVISVWGILFYFIRVFDILTNVFCLIQALSTFGKHGEGLDGRREQKRAQTTRLVSFGPQVRVFVILYTN